MPVAVTRDRPLISGRADVSAPKELGSRERFLLIAVKQIIPVDRLRFRRTRSSALARGAAVKRYDPLDVPPQEWLDISEGERLRFVERYHRRTRVPLPNVLAHASLHVIVENQAALGDETPVRRTLDRLMNEGIDRHEAVHAVASVLAEHMAYLVRNTASKSDPNAGYYAALERLTVESWRQRFGSAR